MGNSTQTEIFLLYVKAPGNPFCRGRPSTIDLLVLTNSDQLLLIMKNVFFFFTQPSILKRRPSVLSISFLLVRILRMAPKVTKAKCLSFCHWCFPKKIVNVNTA